MPVEQNLLAGLLRFPRLASEVSLFAPDVRGISCLNGKEFAAFFA